MGLKNYWTVRRSKLIDILNAAKKEQSMPRIRWIRGALGVACIAAGYYLALNILRLEINFLLTSVLIVILVCIGTYFFFGSFLAIILNALIRKKKIIYKGSRLVSFSNTLFRLRTHYRSLSMTAILCAATLAALSGSLALKYFADANAAMEAPYSISYINQDEATDRKIKEMIQDSPRKILGQNRSHFEAFMHCQFVGSICMGASLLMIGMAVFYIFMSSKYRDMVMKGWGSHETALS